MKPKFRRDLQEAGESVRRTRQVRIAAGHRRDEAILKAFESGVPIAKILEITGLSQPNAARARRRALARRERETG